MMIYTKHPHESHRNSEFNKYYCFVQILETLSSISRWKPESVRLWSMANWVKIYGWTLAILNSDMTGKDLIDEFYWYKAMWNTVNVIITLACHKCYG